MSSYEVIIKQTFSAAHSLRGYLGDCSRVHGHNWIVEVAARSKEVDQLGLAIDFKELKGYTNEIISQFDHRNLNDVPPFDDVNPSAELIARYFYEEIDHRLQGHDIELSQVTIWENANCGVTYRP